MKHSAFQDFNEYAQDALDFARCQRPDGSYYGTGGQCRKGTQVGAKEKAEKKTKEKAGDLSQAEFKAFAAEIAGRNSGDGMVFDEGSEPPMPVEKMSQQQLKDYVKGEFEYSFGPDSGMLEFPLEELEESNPKLAAKIKSVVEKNGGTLPAKSVTAEAYYHDGDKSKHPSIRGTINGVKFDMPEMTGQPKSEGDGDYGLYLGTSYYQ